MASVVRAFVVMLLAGLTPAPAAPKPAAQAPGLAAFVAAAKKMGVTFDMPAGYSEVLVRKNMDMAYDYAIVSANKKIEMRFALRPYAAIPEPMRDAKMALTFFIMGMSNLIRGGEAGRFADPQSVPAEHFNADDAQLVAVRWYHTKQGSNAFGDGYE